MRTPPRLDAEQPYDPVGCGDHEQDQQQTHDQQIDLGMIAEPVADGGDLLDAAEQKRTDQRPIQLVMPPIKGIAMLLTA